MNPDFFISLSKNSNAFHVYYWAFVIASLLTLGVVLCARIKNSHSFKTTRAWALLGLALSAVDFSRMHYNAIRLASEFLSYSESVRAFILQHGIDRLDPYGLAFSLLGIHIFYWNYLIIRTQLLPEWIACLGMFGGVLLQFVFIGTLTYISLMIDIAAGLGDIIIFPIQLISFGLWHLKALAE